MLQRARERFGGEGQVWVVEHDLEEPLPGEALGTFDAVVSSIAIHHLEDGRKRALYEEVFALLEPGGAFLNLDRVASPTPALRRRFLVAMGHDPYDDVPSDRPLDVETQLRWLREIGFADVDCHWKWLELALLGGVKPAG
jgi:tRNA (cmo5U34)-methyltransferase